MCFCFSTWFNCFTSICHISIFDIIMMNGALAGISVREKKGAEPLTEKDIGYVICRRRMILPLPYLVKSCMMNQLFIMVLNQVYLWQSSMIQRTKKFW